ncbi:ROK family transcriptional regulator, partial [Cellulomonas hominis]|nr:ROK family transcriptional regulator [Cellulomonas hominis]
MNRREGRAVVAPRDSRALLLDALRRADALTQVELASATALSPGTV